MVDQIDRQMVLLNRFTVQQAVSRFRRSFGRRRRRFREQGEGDLHLVDDD